MDDLLSNSAWQSHFEETALDHPSYEVGECVQGETLWQLIRRPGRFEHLLHRLSSFQTRHQRHDPAVRPQRGLKPTLNREYKLNRD